MKKIFLFFILTICTIALFAQQQTFDITTYTPPKGWKKQTIESSLQFSKEDAATGGYCLIMLLKSMPGNKDAKANFDMAWETVVKEMVKVSAAPEMQPPATEDGWQVHTGYAPFENEGEKGIALLVTTSGYNKIVNMIILTNTDVFEKDIADFTESISFNKPTETNNNSSPNKNTDPVTVAKKDGFAFTISNFDDGWTSTVQEDWVEVKKGNIKVLLHYPKEEPSFPTGDEQRTNIAWNTLVAPRYSNMKNYKTTEIGSYNKGYLGMGNVTDNASNRQVFVVLFRRANSGWIEIISPDKNSFIQQFKFDPETILWNSDEELVKPLTYMHSYNKFAVAESDFQGTWSNDFTGLQQFYNAYSGYYVGSTMTSVHEIFQFGAGNTYNRKISSLSGVVGNAKYAETKSAGKFTMPNNWQIEFSDIGGEPLIYYAQFLCIKGARVLKLLSVKYPGSGKFEEFGKQ